MALFSSASRSVKLYFTADSTQVDRALARTETRLKRFERVAGKGSTLNSGLIGGFSKGGAIAAGAGLAVLGIKNVTDAAKNAQVILGQTSVAVEDAGLSWEKYGAQVQAASLRIAKSSAFDDEQVLQSFSTFVRGQKDVEKSLLLSQLAADVARGRYTDLATATALVNKAALGQIGALRRAGIQIDKNATATEALAALQAAYGGAAVRYANSAAGAQDKLRVSVENLKESLGNGLLPVLTQVVGVLDEATQAAGILANAFKGLGVTGSGIGKTIEGALLATPGLGLQIGELKLINKLFGGKGGGKGQIKQPGIADILAAEGIHDSPSLTKRGSLKVTNPTKGRSKTGAFDPIPVGLQIGEANARLTGNRSAIKGALKKEADVLKAELAKGGLSQDKVLAIKQALLGVTEEINAINNEILQDAKDKKQALKDQAAKIAAARKALAEKLKQQASDFKSKALDLLNLQSSRRDDEEALKDAKANLKILRQLGGKQSIHKGEIAVADARDQVLRDRIQAASVRANGNGTFTVHIGNLNLNGVQNPKQLIQELQKAGRRGTHQSRGTIAGRNSNVGIG